MRDPKRPSVTTVLAVIRMPWLEQWRGRVGNEEADRRMTEGGGIGTRIHKAVQLYVSRSTCISLCRCDQHPCPGFLSRLSVDVRPALERYIPWHQENIAEVLFTEADVSSEKHAYFGRADAGVIFHDDPSQPAVIDYKSGSADEKTRLQLSAYQTGALETLGLKLPRRVTVKVPKDGGPIERIEYDPEDAYDDWQAFLHLRAFWQRWYELGEVA